MKLRPIPTVSQRYGADRRLRYQSGVDMRRREFLSGSSLLLPGTCFACARPLQSQAVPRDADLREELSASELETVNNSVMAKDLDNFFGKGFS